MTFYEEEKATIYAIVCHDSFDEEYYLATDSKDFMARSIILLKTIEKQPKFIHGIVPFLLN